MRRELLELEEKVDCRTWTELGLVESAMTATSVEERRFPVPLRPSEHQEELLRLIRAAAVPEQRRWNRQLAQVEARPVVVGW